MKIRMPPPPTRETALQMHTHYTEQKSKKYADMWLDVYNNYDKYIEDWNEKYIPITMVKNNGNN